MVSVQDLVKNLNRITKELKNIHHKQSDGEFNITYDSFCDEWRFEYNSYIFGRTIIIEKDYEIMLNIAKVKLNEFWIESKELVKKYNE